MPRASHFRNSWGGEGSDKDVIKHAEASHVEVNITRTGDELSVVLEDNGRGFDTRTRAEGIGLSNIRKRTDSLRGGLNIDSAIGRGTIVSVSLPLG